MAEIKDFNSPIEPNSSAYKESKSSKEKEKPKVKAKVKEKTFKQKMKEAIIADDVGDIKEYAILKVLIPNIKKMVRSALLGMFDMRFFGKSMGSGLGGGTKGGQVVDYSRHSSDIWADTTDELQRRADEKRSGNVGSTLRISEVSNVQFATEEEAINILRYLKGAVEEYGVVSVADFIERSGLNANHNHRKWGWYDLDAATVEIDDDTDMYYIRFPKPKSI
jgi:hypothetical protein